MASVEEKATVEISPLLAQIVEGTIESAKMEMEAAIDRTARSLLIKEQHDYRTAIFDAECNSVCSVSFCGHVDPIPKKWSREEIYEDDVFIWNDVYLSEGGIGHLPDICVTRPIIFEGELIGFANAFGHTDDIGGMLPGGMPTTALEVYQEGLMIPPLKLYDRGVLNEAVYELILRNSRFPENLRGDIDAEVAALTIGAERIKELCRRYGRETVTAAFEHIIERCARSLREDAFPLIKNGEYFFEDFVEWDGVTPEETRRFIRICLKMIKTDDDVVWDFSGTDAPVAGSINWPTDDRYIEKLVGSHFRTLPSRADCQPRRLPRHARADPGRHLHLTDLPCRDLQPDVAVPAHLLDGACAVQPGRRGLRVRQRYQHPVWPVRAGRGRRVLLLPRASRVGAGRPALRRWHGGGKSRPRGPQHARRGC